MDFTAAPLGDRAVLLEFGNQVDPEIHENVRRAAEKLEKKKRKCPWMIETVPAFTTVALYYDPLKVPLAEKQTPYQAVCRLIKDWLADWDGSENTESRTVEIPVCYGGEYGPDLAFVAKYHHLTEEEVITIHTEAEYLVYMIGFAPGFPYLGGMSEEIATPRRKTPRKFIPAGSVGIAGSQTGVYPLETPGGWQLIGRTPMSLFRPDNDPPVVLQAGDRIRFRPISVRDFANWGESDD